MNIVPALTTTPLAPDGASHFDAAAPAWLPCSQSKPLGQPRLRTPSPWAARAPKKRGTACAVPLGATLGQGVG